ncbi:hypothetical protein PybrP1_002632 [[Pythium] brassicae (nom. inval.)]|nr:hypothetical protein PybrP1_002632 [[Pythium] brassicae (nom. inval.)]
MRVGVAPSTEKRTGRPAHPLWAHFHRGEKRNRYHYHAFCVYCVAQHGAAHVAPTRGVSVDMLKHIENCANCPLRVLESVRAICGRRDAVRFDRLLRKKAASSATALGGTAPTHDDDDDAPDDERHADGDMESDADAGLPQQRRGAAAAAAAAGDREPEPSGELGERDQRFDPHDDRSACPDASHGTGASAAHGKHTLHRRGHDDETDSDPLPPTAKRFRPQSSLSPRAAENAALEWQTQLLKAAVAAGLPFEAFEDPAVQCLLRRLRPHALSSSGAVSHALVGGLRDPQFLSQAARRLERVQLERVKEGMHNSTIKGGLTLSVNCWTTLDLQQLVAFSLVNSNGDAACVHVLDMGTQARAYSAAHLAAKVEDVLAALEAQAIRVMGIVADSTVALNAARGACAVASRRSLLVVPCFARQLGVLAGSLLTHAQFRDAVGQTIEIAAYFSNAPLQRALRRVSGGGDDARIPLPNRADWRSFVDCIGAMLKYCDVVTALCSTESDDAADAVGIAVPLRLKELVFADEGRLWKTLQELHTLLLPLQESHQLVFGGRARAAAGGDGAAPHDKPIPAGATAVPAESGECFVAPAHGLTLAHVMYQLARMNQQYAGLVGTHHESLAQMMRERIRVVWQRYDFPAMLLAYVFNFHLDTALLNLAHEALQWDAIATYFQAFFAAWFQSHAPAAVAVDVESTDTTAAAAARPGSAAAAAVASPTGTVLGPISADKVRSIFSAYKTKQFPFDADTTSDYVDVSSFYSFVSDSHPEMCALCCRMYAISLLSANVQRIVRGVGFVPTSTQTTKDPRTVELLLHVGFASSLKRVARRRVVPRDAEAGGDDSDSDTSTSSEGENGSGDGCVSSYGVLAGLSAVMAGYHPDEIFWNDDVWDDFAGDWEHFIELELATDEFDAVTEHMVAHARETASSSLQVVEVMSRKVPLDDVFVGTLAPLRPSEHASTKARAATSATSEQDETVLL